MPVVIAFCLLSQTVVDAESGIVYPAAREKTPVPLVYVRPVAVDENADRASVFEKYLLVEPSRRPSVVVPNHVARERYVDEAVEVLRYPAVA